MAEAQKICFIVMGFGKKTDYETGRTLDLNETYSEIIKPAVENAGFRCIRADEISHSGLIDVPMYKMLLNAELVIADISTGNINAVYELGIRHALKRNRTIIMKELGSKFSFDLDHTATFQYKHLGEEIGAKEARRAQAELSTLIKSIFEIDEADSPLYSFLPNLTMPILTEEEIQEIIEESNENENLLINYIDEGEAHIKLDEFKQAASKFAYAHELRPNEPYILQRLVLATYKSKEPSELESLMQARTLLAKLFPEESNDPETTGLAGAIQKRLWLITHDSVQLDKAIEYYSRGFTIKKDYYNGENLASCLSLKSVIQSDASQKAFYETATKNVRLKLYDLINELICNPDFEDRNDKKWIFATLANVCFHLGKVDEGNHNETLFLAEDIADWERKSYFDSKETIPNLE
jgi:tetratricopeptide (TPR) repeat protein